MTIAVTESAAGSWLERSYTPLRSIVTRFIPDQVKMVCFILWCVDFDWLPEAHPAALSLPCLDKTEGQNQMKSSCVGFSPSSSPPHLIIAVGYAQSLWCRKGVLVNTQRFFSAAPFFFFVSSVPTQFPPEAAGDPCWGTWSTFCPFSPSCLRACRVVSHTFPLHPGCQAVFRPSSHRLSPRRHRGGCGAQPCRAVGLSWFPAQGRLQHGFAPYYKSEIPPFRTCCKCFSCGKSLFTSCTLLGTGKF